MLRSMQFQKQDSTAGEEAGAEGDEGGPSPTNMIANMFAARFANKMLDRQRTHAEMVKVNEKEIRERFLNASRAFDRLRGHLKQRKLLNQRHLEAVEKLYDEDGRLMRPASAVCGLLETTSVDSGSVNRRILRTKTAQHMQQAALLHTLSERTKRNFTRRTSNASAHTLSDDQQDYWSAVKEAVRESKSVKLQQQQARLDKLERHAKKTRKKLEEQKRKAEEEGKKAEEEERARQRIAEARENKRFPKK